MTDLRKELEQQSSKQLSEWLHAETEKEIPNDDLVLLILDILETRDADKPVELGPKSQIAWKKYQERAQSREEKKAVIPLKWITRAASFFLVGIFLTAMIFPQQVTAGSFWKTLSSWTDDFFEYVNLGDAISTGEYVFETEIPGLQQVYEAVVEELEITKPVVPMWLPGELTFVDMKVVDTPALKSVHAWFHDGEREIVLIFDKMGKDFSPTYYKSEQQVLEYERNGIIHNFVRNNEIWVISWTRDNIKCSIFVDCQEDILEDIVKSIY